MKFLKRYLQIFEARKSEISSDITASGGTDKFSEELYDKLILNDDEALSAWKDIEALQGRYVGGYSGGGDIHAYTKGDIKIYLIKDAYGPDKDAYRISFKRNITSTESIVRLAEDGSWKLTTQERTISPLYIDETLEGMTADKIVKSMQDEDEVSYFFALNPDKIKKYTDPKTGKEKHYGEFHIEVSFSDGDNKLGDQLMKKLGVNRKMSGLAKALRFLWAWAIARKGNRYLDESKILTELLDEEGQKLFWDEQIPAGERYPDPSTFEEIDRLKTKKLEELTDEEKRKIGFYDLYTELRDIPEISNFLKRAYEKLGFKVDLIKGELGLGFVSRGAVKQSGGGYTLGINISPVFNSTKDSILTSAIYALEMDDSDINLSDEEFEKKVKSIESQNIIAKLKKETTGIEVQLSKRDTFDYTANGKKLYTDPKKPNIYFIEFSKTRAFKRLLLDGKNSILYSIFKEGSSGKRLILDQDRISAAFVYNLMLNYTEKLGSELKSLPSEAEEKTLFDKALAYAINKSTKKDLIKRILSVINPNLSKEISNVAPTEMADTSKKRQKVKKTTPPESTTSPETPSDTDDDDLISSIL